VRINLTNKDTGIKLGIEGELDRETLSKNLWDSLSKEAQQQLQKARHATIDLGKVARADTAGLAWLLNAIRDMRSENTDVSVINIPQKLIDLAKLSNADKLITA
jgi:phospholipid transport system transporter-binding protein